ncbi:haloacid dehalogenase type II [Mycobacterium sp. KBS0706]|uniref:haloacid dehalogenase type II n=1 Tax=Mycobacterium sp. KBS0706 TaxID=2578109 RepID=UPI00110F8C4C|nr:haloacid dehalogenase type II [Mycobacterium sp. KBS0706]TSD87273.1 haloacid dehalogenase type II [Mycobacterium sp. KBS0706]
MDALTGVKACVFDAYGTLFDTASAARRSAEFLGDKAGPLAALWREKQLAYTWLRAVQGRHADFWQVTGDALDFALEALAIERPGLRDRLMQLYLTLDPYPEVPEVLRRLRAAGLKTAILSNGTPRMIEALVAGAELEFDALLSVEQAGAYKPHASVYQLALDAFGLPARAIAFQSSNGWDAYGASAFGLQVVWCNRSRQPRERLPGAPNREVDTLAALPGLVGA